MRIDSPNLVGTTTITGSASITGSLVPGADSSYNFGSIYKKWNNVYASAFSGSLTSLADGSSYLLAGNNIIITTGSSGAVTISSTSAAGTLFGGGTPNYLPRFSSSNSLEDSIIYNSQDEVGVGSVSQNSRLFISGTQSTNKSVLKVKAGVSSPNAPIVDIQNSNGDSLLFVSGSGSVGIGTTSTTDKLSVNGPMSISGSLLPGADVMYSLGSVTNRWANIYTGDLHLRNERGDWTLIEEENFLTIRNNKTGKRYIINMTPIPELDEKIGNFSTGPKPG